MSAAAKPSRFRLGEWLVVPQECRLEGAGESHSIEPKLMDVLVFLCERAGEVVSAEELLVGLWRGTFYGDNPVHKSIAQLRRVLGDSATQPRYIATIRKRGYQITASVSFALDQAPARSHAATWTKGNPYPGLSAFDVERHAVFYGRSQAQAAVLSRLQSRLAERKGFVLVLGPSGSGKTSLLQAGVVPLLAQPGGFDGCQALCVARLEAARVADNPAIALADALLQWRIGDEPVFFGTEQDSLLDWLQNDRAALLDTLNDRLLRRGLLSVDPQRKPFLLLVLDQMERALARNDDAISALDWLFDALATLLECGYIAVLAGCRNDFYPKLAQVEALVELKSEGGQFDLPPLSPGEIAQIIRAPAQASGLAFEIDRATGMRLDDVLRDAAILHPQSLPLLQHTLSMLYDQRTEAGMLTFAAYREVGGLAGSLAKHAERAYASLPDAAQRRLPDLLRKMIAVDEEDRLPVSRQVLWSQIGDADMQTLIRGFVDQRLFVSVLLGDEPAFAATHESLFRNWPRIRGWIEENQRLLLVRSRVAHAQRRWHDEGEHRDFLLPRGGQLDDAQRLAAETGIGLNADERRFIRASLRRAQIQAWARAGAIAAILVLGLLAGVAGVIATIQRREALQQRSQAESLVGFMLGKLTDSLRPLGKLDLLDAVGNEAMKYLVSVPSEASNVSVQLLRERALRQIGEIRLARGDSKGAAESFDRAAALSQTITVDYPDNADAWLDFGNAAFWQGQIKYRALDYTGATTSWNQYLEASRKLNILRPDDAKAILELSYAYNNLGTAAYRQGQYAQARKQFELSLDLKERAIEQDRDNPDIQAETADTLNWLGSIEETSGDLTAAARMYQRAATKLGALQSAHPDDQRWRYRGAIAAMRVGDMYLAEGKIDESQASYQLASEALRALCQVDPQNKNWARDASYATLSLARVETLVGHRAEGEKLMQFALATIDKLAASRKGTDDYRRLIAHAHIQTYEIGVGDPAHTLTALSSDIDDLNAASASTKATDVPSQSHLLAKLLVTRADLEGDPQKHSDVQSALSLLSQPALSQDNPAVQELKVRALLEAGRRAEAQPLIESLSHAGYRHPAYLQFLQSH